MAAQRIRTATCSGLPRCQSEGTLFDLNIGCSEPKFSDVKVPSPSALLIDNCTSLGNVKEVIAIKDYCPSNFTTLKFSKGDYLYVLDSSGGDWWYAHNTTEMGYIPSAYVQPLNHRYSSLSDSGMIDSLIDSPDSFVKELDFLGDWADVVKTSTAKTYHNNPFFNGIQTNPFLNSKLSAIPSHNNEYLLKTPVDLFDPLAPSYTELSSANKIGSCLNEDLSYSKLKSDQATKEDNPYFRNKRSYSLSELSVLQAKSENSALFGFSSGLKSPTPDEFQSRDDFRTAWLNHRKLTRSCHDLNLLGQNPGWGQTQPVETNIVCKLDSFGGAIQLPNTNISIHIPEGHVLIGEVQQISMKAVLDPPLELNSDRSITISPVLEIKLSNMEVKSLITLKMKVSAEVKNDTLSKSSVGIMCLRSDTIEGPYSPVPKTHCYGDTIQAQLDNLGPCMYLAAVAQAQNLVYSSTVWDYISKKFTMGVYGPKHIHPSFKTVVTIFGHDCAPKTLLVNEVAWQDHKSASIALQLWGKHQFELARPQDLKVYMYSNMINCEVRASEQTRIVRGFQMKLGKVSCLIFHINCHTPNMLSDFTLRIQVKDHDEDVLTQFCVQTPQPPSKTGLKNLGQRRFLKKNEVGKIILSPLTVTWKYPTFRDCPVANLKYGKLLKTVVRQSKNCYLLEYKKGDAIVVLSEEKIKLKGQLWTKEWYIGYYQGKIGLVHNKNVLIMGKSKPSFFSGPDLTTGTLLEQILRPCKFLTYIYASVRTLLMENICSWRSFADALGYVNLPLAYFCRSQLDSESERVASVLEKLKEDSNNLENMNRKSFQKELMMALLKMDSQGLVVRLLQDFVLLSTAVEISQHWRELADKLTKISKQQIEAYEAPHRDKNGIVDNEAMWKPAYDFLLTWSQQMGDSYRDVIQELHTALDRMKNPITKRWHHLTGTLILVNSLEVLQAAAFNPLADHENFVI
uniref:SH3 domain-binding protein 4 n=1 Tax=Geotrypetes seraphini TaxID=260995 RepID=A0A6P8RG78_GEOSA|nr:SH3 domain-binding protein 4 [Geotrypetes seraphini]XP_033800775.1 SH3 domain-binding protein 4 [Geotrypetes seraphini]XP_033800776.1 SH3 domain-binding protein 4 [Geotrypetes seraphini]XP_033800777.1 SH3 domain-binding protein 4 [Geotrypetes seraphini]XP_033800778.1 SH3 domain-binding protein 4 [Geotrypetes seraphini]